LGAIVAGTIKARDKLVRSSDLRAFRDGIASQVLVGAGSALFFLLVMESGVLEFGDVDEWAGQAVGGFVAGFAEPYFVKTVARVATLGSDGAEPSGH
jgi:hypothetical protein